MNDGLLLVISGPSGSGKGTAVEQLKKVSPNIGVSVSATTRAPREGEADGVNYYYISRAEFEKKLEDGEILEHTEYCGNLYGTPKSEVDRIRGEGRDLILEIEVEGALQIKKLYPDAVTIMLVPPSMEELRRRLTGRGSEDAATVEKRISRAAEEILLAPEYDYVVVNETNKIDECVQALLDVISAEHRKSFRMSDFINNFSKSDK